jgi:uncharacterized iron-regulated membrane protein
MTTSHTDPLPTEPDPDRPTSAGERVSPARGNGAGPSGAASAGSTLRPLLLRLHFYAGVLIGPFLLIAATTGLLYTATPQLENALYRHELRVTPQASATVPLAEQVTHARAAVPRGTLQSVSPPPGPSDTTRVVFAVHGLPDGYDMTAFIDPYDGHVLGVLRTSGQWLPARAWLDSLHRTLLLGDFGRNYSELAASWLWVEVLGGVALWVTAPRNRGRLRDTLRPRLRGAGRQRVMSWHAVVGLCVSVGLLGLSATGLTWSNHAGANISELRAQLKGGTPSVSTTLPTGKSAADVGIDTVFRSARRAGLTGLLVITPPSRPGTAYVVQENTRHWPERQDSVAIDPATGKVTATQRFADYPLLAKLTRWGIDAHMGLLFGLANQIVLALLAMSLIAIILWGYRMWWLRRPTRNAGFALGRAPARGTWRRLPGRVLAPAVVGTAVLGYFLPLLGIPLVLFLVVDLTRAAIQRRTAKEA